MTTVKSIDAIQSRIREIEAELAADTRQQELIVLRETEKKLLAINGAASGAASVRPNGGGLQRLKPRARRGGSMPKGKVSQHEAAKIAVDTTGHPMTTDEIVAAMPRFGARIGGQHAARNLTSILSKRGDLTSVRWREKRAWWFRDREFPN